MCDYFSYYKSFSYILFPYFYILDTRALLVQFLRSRIYKNCVLWHSWKYLYQTENNKKGSLKKISLIYINSNEPFRRLLVVVRSKWHSLTFYCINWIEHFKYSYYLTNSETCFQDYIFEIDCKFSTLFSWLQSKKILHFNRVFCG